MLYHVKNNTIPNFGSIAIRSIVQYIDILVFLLFIKTFWDDCFSKDIYLEILCLDLNTIKPSA